MTKYTRTKIARLFYGGFRRTDPVSPKYHQKMQVNPNRSGNVYAYVSEGQRINVEKARKRMYQKDKHSIRSIPVIVE